MTESQLQQKCVTWFWNEYPAYRGMFFAVTNNSENIGRAMLRRGMGLVAGVSDTILLCRGRAYMIEFKTETGRQSKAQKAWEERVRKEGFMYFIVRNENEFMNLIREII